MIRKRAAIVMLLSACCVALAGESDKATETPPQAVVRLTNEYRDSQKGAALATDPVLSRVAQDHAENMARQDKYGDDGKNGHILDGKGPKDRVDASGYKYRAFAENVGMNNGYADPVKAVIEAWIKSELHKKNMLNEVYVEMGAGAARSESGKWYFCQVFGKPRVSGKK